MNIKNKLVFEHKIEDRTYSMVMNMDSPLGEAYQAAGAFMDEVVRLINEHAQKRQDSVKQENQEEEVISE